jgi:hypothetical protein
MLGITGMVVPELFDNPLVNPKPETLNNPEA